MAGDLWAGSQALRACVSLVTQSARGDGAKWIRMDWGLYARERALDDRGQNILRPDQMGTSDVAGA